MTGATRPVEALRRSDVFGRFTPLDFAALEPHLSWLELPVGERLFEQGDAADALYFLESGSLDALVSNTGAVVTVGRLQPGELAGEMQVLFGGVRSATVVATVPSRLVMIPRSALAALDGGFLSEGLSGLILERLRRNQLRQALRTLFGELDDGALRPLEDACEWVDVRRGEVVCEAGETADCLYVVVNGWLRAHAVDGAGRETPLSDLGSGECVGEMALITGEPRMATVRALRDCDLVRLQKPVVDSFLRGNPDALLHLTRLVVRRYQSALRAAPLRRAARSIAVLPLARDERLLPEFASALARALAAHGPVIHLTSAAVDRSLGVPGISLARPGSAEGLRMSAWLRQLEENYRFVLFEADRDTDSGPSPWTLRVLREADEQVLVADAAEAPDLRPAERAGSESARAEQVRLVLVHPGTCEHPRGSAAWLAPRSVSAHHHCRRDNRADIDRVARFLAGAQTGLVLGGGGVRGLAHIGVLRALEEARIPVDIVGGTSIGAVIGVQYALGRDRDSIFRQTRKAFANLVDYTLPAVALAAGTRLGESLRQAMGGMSFEDTWLPFFCVASNLTRAEVQVLDRGPLWRAVRASCGLPGVFPPIGIDGDLLVDGCLLNNLPVDIMARRCAGPIVAVDATPPVDLEAQAWTGDAISGLRYLLGCIGWSGRESHPPGIARVLQRACELSSVRAHRSRMRDAAADLLVTPAVGAIPTLDVRYADEAVEIGYRAAVAALQEWPGRNARRA